MEKHEDYEEICKQLVTFRDQLGISQSEFAKKLNIPQSTYAGYEIGIRRIPASLLKRISKTFNVSADYLLDLCNANPAYAGNHTIAANHADEMWTSDELEYIELTKKLLLQKRLKNLAAQPEQDQV